MARRQGVWGVWGQSGPLYGGRQEGAPLLQVCTTPCYNMLQQFYSSSCYSISADEVEWAPQAHCSQLGPVVNSCSAPVPLFSPSLPLSTALPNTNSLAIDILANDKSATIILAARHYGSRTFWQHNILATQNFGNTSFWQHIILVTARHFGNTTFWHYRIFPSRHFATQTLWHHDMLPPQIFDISNINRLRPTDRRPFMALQDSSQPDV